MPPFPLPHHVPSWFVGHMARSLRILPKTLANIDLVIEVRDARLPLSSVNPAFEKALHQAWGGAGWDRKGKGRAQGMSIESRASEDGRVGSSTRMSEPRGRERMVVYTKRDLAEARYEDVSEHVFLPQLTSSSPSTCALCHMITDVSRCAKHFSNTLTRPYSSPTHAQIPMPRRYLDTLSVGPSCAQSFYMPCISREAVCPVLHVLFADHVRSRARSRRRTS